MINQIVQFSSDSYILRFTLITCINTSNTTSKNILTFTKSIILAPFGCQQKSIVKQIIPLFEHSSCVLHLYLHLVIRFLMTLAFHFKILFSVLYIRGKVINIKVKSVIKSFGYL